MGMKWVVKISDDGNKLDVLCFSWHGLSIQSLDYGVKTYQKEEI